MWSQHWNLTDLRNIDREARKVISENGGKHPLGSTALLYLPRHQGGRGLRSVETEYKHTKIKSAIKLYQNKDPTMSLVRASEERAVDKGNQSLIKEASTFAEEMGISLELSHPRREGASLLLSPFAHYRLITTSVTSHSNEAKLRLA